MIKISKQFSSIMSHKHTIISNQTAKKWANIQDASG